MYPNAAGGIKKILIAEILYLIAIILGAATSVTDIVLSNAAGENESTSAAVTILGIGMGVVALIAFFLNIIGVNEAARDESAFKKASFAILVAIVLTLANGFFNVSNLGFIQDITEIVVDMASLVVTLFIIIGVRNIAKNLEDEKMEKKGGSLLNIVFIFSAISVLVKAVLLIIGDKTAVAVASLFVIIAAILAVVKYILYLSYLSKANKMLAE